jgi:hypothetical protein
MPLLSSMKFIHIHMEARLHTGKKLSLSLGMGFYQMPLLYQRFSNFQHTQTTFLKFLTPKRHASE